MMPPRHDLVETVLNIREMWTPTATHNYVNTAQHKIRQDRTQQDKTRQNKTRQAKTAQHNTPIYLME